MNKKYSGEEIVLKHGLASRLYHWALILGFLPAALTGIIIWLKPGSADFVNFAMRVHIAGAVVFTISSLLYGVFCTGRVVAFLRTCFEWKLDDLRWLAVSGGYPQKIFLGKEIQVPSMGKINSGQKLFGICLFFGGILLLLTGWLLYAFLPMVPKEIAQAAGRLHWLVGLFLTAFLCCGHIVLGLYNWRECICMFGDGKMKVADIAKHNELWLEELEPAAEQAKLKLCSPD